MNEKDRRCSKNTRQNSSDTCPRWVFLLASAWTCLFFLFYLNLPNTPQKNPSRFLLNQERRLQLNAFASSVNTGHPTPSSLTRFSVSLASLPPSFPPNYHLTCACSYGCLCVFSWGFIKGLAPGKLTGRARFCPPGLRDRF